MNQLTGILLSLVLMLGLMSGMGSTAYAATLDGNSTTWSEDSTITGNVTIEVWDDTENEWLGVTVTDDITLTIPAGSTLTVRNGINADGHTLTVQGEGYDYQAMPAASKITPLMELKEFERKWGAHRYDAAVLQSMGYYDSFDASTTLNIRLQFREAPGAVSAKVNGKAWKVNQLDDTTYLIEIPNIDAYRLGKRWHVEVTADGHIVYDANLSALSYVSAVLASERYQVGEAEALTAFYNYYDAVNPYHT